MPQLDEGGPEVGKAASNRPGEGLFGLTPRSESHVGALEHDHGGTVAGEGDAMARSRWASRTDRPRRSIPAPLTLT